jgi:hypothetical protein
MNSDYKKAGRLLVKAMMSTGLKKLIYRYMAKYYIWKRKTIEYIMN